MAKVLIAYATRHGATRGIAERLGDALRREGLEVVVAPTHETHDVGMVDAIIVGSGVYMGAWLPAAVDFLLLHEGILGSRDVWLFSSGPLGAARTATDPLETALGPREGPGSGGRRRVQVIADAVHVHGHRVFDGAFDPSDPPKVLAERLVRLMPAARNMLRPGDFRDWAAVDAWGREIAASLRETGVPA